MENAFIQLSSDPRASLRFGGTRTRLGRGTVKRNQAVQTMDSQTAKAGAQESRPENGRHFQSRHAPIEPIDTPPRAMQHRDSDLNDESTPKKSAGTRSLRRTAVNEKSLTVNIFGHNIKTRFPLKASNNAHAETENGTATFTASPAQNPSSQDNSYRKGKFALGSLNIFRRKKRTSRAEAARDSVSVDLNDGLVDESGPGYTNVPQVTSSFVGTSRLQNSSGMYTESYQFTKRDAGSYPFREAPAPPAEERLPLLPTPTTPNPAGGDVILPKPEISSITVSSNEAKKNGLADTDEDNSQAHTSSKAPPSSFSAISLGFTPSMPPSPSDSGASAHPATLEHSHNHNLLITTDDSNTIPDDRSPSTPTKGTNHTLKRNSLHSNHQGTSLYRNSSRSGRSIAGSIHSMNSTLSVNHCSPHRTSFLSRLRRSGQYMCLGYEPNAVRASDNKSKSVGKSKKAAGVKRLGWFAVDLEHGWEVVGHLSSTMIQALGVRFVVCSEREQADELSHPHHHGLSFFHSDDTGRDDFFVDTRRGSLASATPTLGAPCLPWLESYDTEGSRRGEDKVIRVLEDTLSNSLYMDTVGALFVSEGLATVPTRILKDLPLLWWPGDIEDWDAEEIDEAVIKQGRPRRTLKAASLRALVYRLASPVESDMVFMNDFLRGFRFVAHPLDVLRLLVVRYFHCVYGALLTPERTKVRWSMNANGTPSHPTTPSATDSGVHRASPSSDHQRAIIQIRVLNVLKRWYDMYPDDFTKFPELSHLLLLFLVHIRHDTRRVNFVKAMVSKLRSRGHIHWHMLETLGTVDPDDLLFPLFVESETQSLHSNQPSRASQSQLSCTDYGLAAALTSGKYSMDSILETQPLSLGTNSAEVNGDSGTLVNKHRSTYKKIFFGGKQRLKRNPSNASEKDRTGSLRTQSNSRRHAGGGSTSLPRVLDLNPKELFHQLTLVEHTMFRDITMDEFCYHSRCGGKAERELLAPCLTGLIQWFNRMAMWVAKQILTTVELEDRIRLVQTFIHIAHQCLIWHNYNTCFEIVSGLTFSSVKRLYKTWEGVSSKAQQMLRQLNSIMSQRPNYKAYRACLRSVWNINGVGAEWEEALGQHLASRGKADEMMEFQVENTGVLQMGNKVPLLPFIGVHLTDFLYSDEGNPSYIEPHSLHDVLPKTVGNWSSLSTANSTTTSLAELGHGSIAGTPRPHEMNGGYYSRRASRQSEQLGRFQSIDPKRPSSTMAKRRSAYSTALPFSRMGDPPTDLSMLTGGSQLLGTTTPNTPTQWTPMSPRTPMSPSASYVFGKSSRNISPPYSATLLRKSEPEAKSSAATVLNFNQVPLVNCFKLRLMSTMLQKIQMAQQNLFPFRENVGLQDWLRTEVNHIYQRQILPTSPFAYQALQENLPLPKHTKVAGRQARVTQSARQSSYGSPRVPSESDRDTTRAPMWSPKSKASSPSLSLSWRTPSASVGNGSSAAFRASAIGCESTPMSPSLTAPGSAVDGIQRRRDTVGDSPPISHTNGVTSSRSSRYPLLSPVPEPNSQASITPQRASISSPPSGSLWSSAINTPMLSPNLPSQQEPCQNPYRKSETTPKLNNLDPNFFQISEDLEEWDIWLHKLSRQLEPKVSGSTAAACSPHSSG
ncbi:hypothetical protein IWQ62_002269 [Dispira parvispora]|uniref:Uncharacterized protein n=1 Tax=Dispira parvispora TaxID=1520584 RepID=A0A9W8AQC6_9FUNG|nr:hypothetical protein IWQ62_002269 [Dispira parvispora]